MSDMNATYSLPGLLFPTPLADNSQIHLGCWVAGDPVTGQPCTGLPLVGFSPNGSGWEDVHNGQQVSGETDT